MEDINILIWIYFFQMSLLRPNDQNGLPIYGKPLAASVDSASSLTSLENVLPINQEAPFKEKSRPVSAPLLDEVGAKWLHHHIYEDYLKNTIYKILFILMLSSLYSELLGHYWF